MGENKMEYYILEQNKEYTDAVSIINWFGKVDVDNIKPEKFHHLKERYVLFSKGNYVADIITMPLLAVSAMVDYCIKKYEPYIESTALYLISEKKNDVFEYFIPHLDEVNCLAAESKINANRTILEKAVIDSECLDEDKYIFNIGKMNARYTVVRSEFAESILKRGAVGIRLIPVTVV